VDFYFNFTHCFMIIISLFIPQIHTRSDNPQPTIFKQISNFEVFKEQFLQSKRDNVKIHSLWFLTQRILLFTQQFLLTPNWKDEIDPAWVNSRRLLFLFKTQHFIHIPSTIFFTPPPKTQKVQFFGSKSSFQIIKNRQEASFYVHQISGNVSQILIHFCCFFIG